MRPSKIYKIDKQLTKERKKWEKREKARQTKEGK